jgi:hypothetical protein
MDTGKIGLAEAIKNLRMELQEAMEEGDGKKLRFEAQDIELEFKCGVTREAGAKAGVKFWVVDAGAEGKIGDEKTQTVKLKLKPVSGDGETTLLNDMDKVR